ncbi:aspartate/glutamate racemase family protein [Chloroflexota bacterium]
MKKIGIVGGLGPESTLYYYRIFIDLCCQIKELDGGYPELVIYSVNMREIMALRSSGPENAAQLKLLEAIDALYKAGADFAIIACNAMHQYYNEIEARSPIPLMSIVEEACREAVRLGLSKVGLFGAAPTMKAGFYQKVFSENGIAIVVPSDEEQAYISGKVVAELARGVFADETRNQYLEIARRMKDEESIQGLVLGCTEIPLLLDKSCEEKLGTPLFDTSLIHMRAALKHSLASD